MTDIESVIKELEQRKNAIENAIAALRGAVGTGNDQRRGPGRPPGSGAGAARKRQSRISEEGRQRIAEALRKRWAVKKAAARKAALANTAPSRKRTKRAGRKAAVKKAPVAKKAAVKEAAAIATAS